MKNSKPKF